MKNSSYASISQTAIVSGNYVLTCGLSEVSCRSFIQELNFSEMTLSYNVKAAKLVIAFNCGILGVTARALYV